VSAAPAASGGANEFRVSRFEFPALEPALPEPFLPRPGTPPYPSLPAPPLVADKLTTIPGRRRFPERRGIKFT